MAAGLPVAKGWRLRAGTQRTMRRIIVGISGASGSIYGLTMLRVLRAIGGFEVHLVCSQQAKVTVEIETDAKPAELEALADVVHESTNLAASISSGSFQTDGMVVVPCSMRSASAIAYSLNDNLLVRAADVCLKERRPLVLVVRETPLHVNHLRNLARAAEAGAIILPPVPGTYARPKSFEDVVNHTIGKVLDQFHIPNEMFKRWGS
jgi:4-hydroxy-3-polyprenylbenzoate decarboxylase